MNIWAIVKNTKTTALVFSDEVAFTINIYEMRKYRMVYDNAKVNYLCFKSQQGEIESLILTDAVADIFLNAEGNTCISLLDHHRVTLRGRDVFDKLIGSPLQKLTQ